MVITVHRHFKIFDEKLTVATKRFRGSASGIAKTWRLGSNLCAVAAQMMCGEVGGDVLTIGPYGYCIYTLWDKPGVKYTAAV